ncbi:MAG: (2Fe-2S)-binding protein, partial [Sulfitobacter sp.]
MTKVTMTINGKSVAGDVEGNTLLSSFLRDDLRLTGTHIGCDTSQCGACVVHVNGRPVKSCTMFAAEAEGAEVSTIEGQTNADGSINVIQQAFQDHHGLQCGFCTPGMVMT